jgi:hypothetical protein
MLDIGIDVEGLDAAFADLEQECADVIRGMSVELYTSILVKTPQYVGGLAASWSYSLNQPEYVDRSADVGSDVLNGDLESLIGASRKARGLKGLRRGHPTAVGVANAANLGREAAFKLGDTIWIANGADHGEGPYSQKIEDAPPSALRAVNRPGRMVGRSVDRMLAHYALDTSKNRARVLSTLKIGGGDAEAGS